jgi:hypothetical protein
MGILPAKGRLVATRQKIALGIAGVAAAIAAVGCGASPPSVAAPSAVEQQSHSPIPTPLDSEHPTIPAPATSPSVGPAVSPTEAPLSPAQLVDTFAAYTGGVDSTSHKVEQKDLPGDGRFYQYSDSKDPALANIMPDVYTDYTRPLVETYSQGYLLDSRVVKASNGKDYLIADIVHESAKDKNRVSEQYILPFNLGCVDSDSSDIDVLVTEAGVAVNMLFNDSTKVARPSPADMQAQLKSLSGRFVIFTLDVIKDATGYTQFRDAGYILAHNAIDKDIIEYSKQTVAKPFDEVSQNESIAITVDKPTMDGFNIADVADIGALIFQ